MTNPKKKKPKFPEDEKDLAELIGKIAKGCESALTKFYDLTISRVYGLALKILTKNHDADEVALDVFKQIWNKAGDYTPERGTPSAWLITLTRSRAIDRIRSDSNSKLKEGTLDYKAPPSDSSADEMADIREKRDLIESALSGLSPGQRKSIELAYYYGLTQTEISDLMNEPLGTVKSWIRAGMSKLRSTIAGPESE
jgi:RNA polymerase sigma-70 factor (ECF subfamily)